MYLIVCTLNTFFEKPCLLQISAAGDCLCSMFSRAERRGKFKRRKLKTLPRGTRRFSLLTVGNTTKETASHNEKRKDRNLHRKIKKMICSLVFALPSPLSVHFNIEPLPCDILCRHEFVKQKQKKYTSAQNK